MHRINDPAFGQVRIERHCFHDCTDLGKTFGQVGQRILVGNAVGVVEDHGAARDQLVITLRPEVVHRPQHRPGPVRGDSRDEHQGVGALQHCLHHVVL